MTDIPFVGILNQGSTCYLNSVIQALYHIPRFRTFIYNIDVSAEPDSVAAAMQIVFGQLEANCSDINTTKLTEAFGWRSSDLMVQQDVHELTQQLFDALEKSVKGTKQQNFIKEIFCGILCYHTSAKDVKYVSDRVEGFYDVELVVSKMPTIIDSLRQLSAPETIEGVSLEVNGPGKPPSVHTVERSQRFVALPPVLLIHPNRVSFDMATCQLVTINTEWSFDTVLDMSEFVTDPDKLVMDKESAEKYAKMVQPDRVIKSTRYKLRSVLVHAGNAQVGHYYSFVSYDDTWYRFNDEVVDIVTNEDVAEAAFGGTYNRYQPLSNTRASLLVYVNEDCAESMLHEVPGPAAIIAKAKEASEEEARRAELVSFSFFMCDHTVSHFLDNVPDAREAVRTVQLPNTAPVEDIEAKLCEELKVAPGGLRVVQQSNAPDFMKRFTAQGYASSEGIMLVQRFDKPRTRRDPPPFIAFVREVGADGEQKGQLQCVADQALLLQLCPGKTIFAVDPRRADAQPLYHTEELFDGINILLCPPEFSKDDVLRFLLNQRRMTTEVCYVDPVRRTQRTSLGRFRINQDSPYRAWQETVFKALPASIKRTMPSSMTAKHIAFYSCRDGFPQALCPLHYHSQEVHVCRLLSQTKPLTLYCTAVPYPVSELSFYPVFYLNVGWEVQPQICIPRELLDEDNLTLRDLMRLAVNQIVALPGAGRPVEAIERMVTFLNATQVEPPVRLLEVKNSQISVVHQSPDDRIELKNATYVLDPVIHPPSTDYRVVDVFFCNRRVGELYFGFPTNVLLHHSLDDTAETVIQRIAKKLKVPASQDVVGKWTLALRGEANHNFCTATSRGDTIGKLVKGINDQEFKIIIDRPKNFCLDMDENERKLDSAIVIKQSASSTSLSNM